MSDFAFLPPRADVFDDRLSARWPWYDWLLPASGVTAVTAAESLLAVPDRLVEITTNDAGEDLLACSRASEEFLSRHQANLNGQDAWRRSLALLRGNLVPDEPDAAVLALVGGGRVRVHSEQGFAHTGSTRVLAGMVNSTHATALCIEPYEGATWIPDYGLSTACNFARSRLNEILALSVRHDPVVSLSRAYMGALLSVHAPDGLPDIDFDLVRSAMTYLEAILASESTFDLPEPRLVKNAAAAEDYAVEVMEALGYSSVQKTPYRDDGGADVTSREAVALVHMKGVATGRPVLQGIFGIASLEGKKALAFSLAGYTTQALEWAEQADMALFEFALDGSLEAASSIGRDLLTP